MEDSALPGPGDIVAGKYRIEREIGRGGMSVVFGSTHDVTGKRFAIKWLLPDEEGLIHEDAAQRFIREAQVAGRFQHPNVVEVYDVGESSGSYYMVMEWLDGESLADRLDDRGPFSFAETCRYLLPCMNGIEEAHQNGIIHRDLKPANIFVCNATKHGPEYTKVLDFGIAKLSPLPGEVDRSVTREDALIGTPYYLSLEQLRNLPVDRRTDVYAFGVMLYQMLSGELPFPADNFGELVIQISKGTPVPIRRLVPNLPPGAEELVARAMARDASDRHPDLGVLIAQMERINAETKAARSGTRRIPSTPSRPSLQTPLATESTFSSASAVPTAPPGPLTAVRVKGAYVAILAVALGAIGWLLHGYYTRESLAEVEEPLPAPATVSNAAADVGTLPAMVHPLQTTLPETRDLRAVKPWAPPPQAAPVAKPAQPPATPRPARARRTNSSGRRSTALATRSDETPTAAPARHVEPEPIAPPSGGNEVSSGPTDTRAGDEHHNPLHMRIQ